MYIDMKIIMHCFTYYIMLLLADNAAIIRDKGQILDIKLSPEMHCILHTDFRAVIICWVFDGRY